MPATCLDFLQRQALSLQHEEEDHDELEDVPDQEDKVHWQSSAMDEKEITAKLTFPFDCTKRDRHTEGVDTRHSLDDDTQESKTLRSDFVTQNLGGIQSLDGRPAEREEDHEQIDK